MAETRKLVFGENGLPECYATEGGSEQCLYGCFSCGYAWGLPCDPQPSEPPSEKE